ncbi:MAG TPA: cation diffusion facilitator family transporter [Bacteroidales bacterium]|nr:cation diffusion facilitator family transporter [Bacteroidales bacterium]
MKTKKTNVARLSVASNSFLIIIKVLAGIVTGSVSILSEAIHSSIDLVAAVIAFFSVKVSDTPPDRNHPYGHGKFENVSGVIEAALIFVAAIWIIIEAVKKLLGESTVEAIGWGGLVMFLSAIVNFLVSRRLYKVARETDSVALEADALHLKTDVLTSLGVGVGLLLIWITDIHLLDPLIAISVAGLIIFEAWQLLRKAYSPLLDSSLGDEDIRTIHQVVNEHSFELHNLRTRKAGNYKFVDMHIEMAGSKTLDEVHEHCNQIEEDLKKRIPHVDVQIHVEPPGNK